MTANEITDYIDLKKMPMDTLRDVLKAFRRGRSIPTTPETLYAQYGDLEEDAERDLQAQKIRAEIEVLNAKAMRDRAGLLCKRCLAHRG